MEYICCSRPIEPVDTSALFDDLVRVEIRTWEGLDRRLRDEHRLPLTWFEPLRAVASSPSGHLRINDIAQRLSITVGGASKLVERIVQAGLLDRREDPDDRRVALVTLTSDGAERFQAAAQTQVDELERRLGQALGPEELATLAALLARLREAAAPSISGVEVVP